MGVIWLVVALAGNFVETEAPGIWIDTTINGGMVLTDLNEDGWLDVVFHDGHGTHLAVNDGQLPIDFTDATVALDDATFGPSSWRQVLVLDLDHDGDKDLLRTSYRGIELLEADNGGYTQALALVTDTAGLYNAEGAAPIDLDGDGFFDIVAEADGYNLVLENDGDLGAIGTSWGTYGFASTFGGWRDYMTAGDVDGNGYVDVVFRTSYDDMALYLQDASGFSIASLAIQGGNDIKAGTPFCDMDNDGDLDIVHVGRDIPRFYDSGISYPADEIYGFVYENTGSGWVVHELEGLPSGVSTWSNATDAVCGDVDNDGDLDLYVPWGDEGHASPDRMLVKNRGNFSFDAVRLEEADGEPRGATMGDVDRDGDLDIIVLEPDDNLNMMINDEASSVDESLFVSIKAHVGDLCESTYRTDWYARASLVGSRSCPDGGRDCGVRELSGAEGRGRMATPWLHFAKDPGATGLELQVRFHQEGGSYTLPVPEISGYPLWVIHDDDLDADGIVDYAETTNDTDGDGKVDYLDDDADGDGISDAVEATGFVRCGDLPDTDEDGIADVIDTDDDGDDIPTTEEGTADPDGDGTPNYLDDDSDGDRTSDLAEGTGDDDGDGVANYLDDDDDDGPQGDLDQDGLTNELEDLWGTDPLDPDSDDDGALDGIEVLAYSTNPLNPDTDGGGALDGAEIAGHTDPLDPLDDLETGRDSDGDGLTDAFEEELGTDPLVADSDGDGLLDGQEVGDTDGDGTIDALDPDDDGDGVPTSEELGRDTDGDRIPDHQDADDDGDGIPTAEDPNPLVPDTVVEGAVDSDHDGLSDAQEEALGTDPLDPDSDDDGVPDGVEGGFDTDGDGVPDALDADDDGDGLPTVEEGNSDLDGDGIPAYLDDDSDGDGIPDGEEGLGDADGDGIPDALDVTTGGMEAVPTSATGCATAPGGALGLGLIPLWMGTVLRRQRR